MFARICSYEALGLAASLNPIASGGCEKPLTARGGAEEPGKVPEASTSGTAKATGAGDVPKGFGKIIRDAQGNVVDVVMPESDDEDETDLEVNTRHVRHRHERTDTVQVGTAPFTFLR